MTEAHSPVPGAAASAPHVPVAQIDASCRWPLLFFFAKAVGWLVVGTVLLLIASIKLHGGGMLAGLAWLSLGRVRPAAMDAILYGFACQAAFGVLLWLVCRLGRTVLTGGGAILTAGFIWNFTVFCGVLGVLGGASTGFIWLEMPRWTAPVFFITYAIIGAGALFTFRSRREGTLYVSQWYVLAALFWFPWIFSAATLLLLYLPARGVLQAAVNAWYTSNFSNFWLTPVGLAVIFYFIPKITGRPLYSRGLAAFGFWIFLFVANWTGLTPLVGGPLPAWMISASIGANFVLILPIICVAMNWYQTLCASGDCKRALHDTALRYVLFGAVCYLMSSAEGILLGTRAVSVITRFTYVEMACSHLALLGFVGMTLLGAIYYIVPRLVQAGWPSAKLVRVHFNWSAIGIAVYFLALTMAGLIQGFKLNDPAVPVMNAVRASVPFIGIATLALLAVVVGQVAFLINLCSLLRKLCEPWCKSVTNLARGGEPAKAEAKA
jgi:cytochrome c oxidase cbb3-type subunit 1